MKKILIIKTHAIGDVLMATPAFRELRRAYPHADISILIGKWSAPILKNNPHITRCLEFDDAILHKRKIFKIIKLIFMLRTYKFDTAIILHPSPFIHLLTVLVGIKNRFGLSRGGKKFFLTSSIDENGSYDYYYPMNFLKVVNLIAGSAVDDKIKIDIKMQVFPHSHDRDVVADLLKIQHVNDLSKLIIISPGGAVNPKESISARVWPWENYAELIRLIIKENSHYSIILTGGNKDKEIISRIHEKEPQAIDLSGKTNIQELISLVGLSQCVICNDSSVLHISIAQNRPTIGIFGPTSIKSRVPPSHIENCVQSAENCSPCYHFGSYPGCNKNALCMRSILPEMVYKKVKKILFSE